MDKKTQYTKAVLVRGLSPEVVAILDELAIVQDRSREYVARAILTKAANDFEARAAKVAAKQAPQVAA